ncbi:MAG: hypothetical protein FJZ93_09145 [Chloroflexi bacterium]|nr:hypothetical protein [Chloroflexota bacterium]MBM4453756.1 hypothetical protein [Chloroflexota bacterium]
MIKKEQMVGTRLPGSLIADLEKIERIEQSDRSSTLRKLLYRAVKDWKLEHYAQEYGRGKMTLARAAEEAEVSIWEMMEHVREKKIPAQYSADDLEHDLKVIYRKSGKFAQPT